MAKYPLDIESMFLEFPEVLRGLKTMRNPITSDSALQKLCKIKNDNIYDYVGIKEAFEYSAQKHASNGISDYDTFLEKLERYMTAHLLLLHIYADNQNLTESPDIIHFGKLRAEGMVEGDRRSGNVLSILQGSNIGQRIKAMLYINANNTGMVL